MVELDVHVCKSGELVVIHDETVDRTTSGKGKVSRLTLSELQAYSIHHNEHIPTLDEVISLVKRKIKINIELKGKNTGKEVALFLKKHFREGWKSTDFLISSFSISELRSFRHSDTRTPLAVLYGSIKFFPLSVAHSLKACAINVDKKSMTLHFLNRCHNKNLAVYVYTVNTKREMQRMKKLGVDGIFSDYPDRMMN